MLNWIPLAKNFWKSNLGGDLRYSIEHGWSRQLNAYMFGLLMILLCWAGIAAKIIENRTNDLRDATRMSENLTALFEENVLRSIGEMDKALLYLRRVVQNRAGSTDWATIVSTTDILSEIIVQVAIIDAKGIMLASNASTLPVAPVDLSDREHFKFHAERSTDELFISKPLIGRASGKWSVQLTRRFNDHKGDFGGVVVASFDPAHFRKFYGQIAIGESASFSLIGTDSVVRASGGQNGEGRFQLGQALNGTSVMRHISLITEGGFATFIGAQKPFEAERLTTVRKVRGQPLVTSVSLTTSEVYADTRNNALVYSTAGLIVTLLVAFLTKMIMRSEARSLRKTELLELTLSHMSQGIILVTKDLDVAIINQKCIELLDLPKSFLHDPLKFDHLINYQETSGEFKKAGVPTDKSSLEHFGPGASDDRFSVYERLRPNGTVLEVRSTRTSDGGFVRTFADVTQRRAVQEYVNKLASEDTLTGLVNRRVFCEALTYHVNASAGTVDIAGVQCAVLCIDLDRFKNVNDTLGHPVGDRLLQGVADRLRRCTRNGDTVARFGGDEFAVLLAGITSAEVAERVAKRLNDALGRAYEIDGHQILISASIGIALCPQDAATADSILVAADLALYAAKASGRGTYRVFRRQMNDDIQALKQIETDLREAIVQRQLELNYQPIIDLVSKRITGFEALTRWRHPVRGLIPPSEFIPVAEDFGLIVPLGLWSLEEACRQAAYWPEDIKIAVNLSPIQICSPGFTASIEHVLAETELRPDRLELEITERILIMDSAKTLAILHHLRALGVRIAMDDFGTGYSSLSYLQSFPFDKIKVDRAFVSKLGDSNDSATVVRAVIDIARSLGMTTTAEGVETEQQLACLVGLGCDEVQGYFFSRPVPTSDLPALLLKYNSGAKLPIERMAIGQAIAV